MYKTISVREFESPIGTYLITISTSIAIVFGLAFWVMSDPFWVGIFRLIAFAGFAGAVLSYLRFRHTPKTLRLENNGDHLVVRYLQNNEELKEEFFEIKTIKSITSEEKSSIQNMFKREACRYKVTFTDSDAELSLFTFGGRDLMVAIQDSAKIDSFLNANGIGNRGK